MAFKDIISQLLTIRYHFIDILIRFIEMAFMTTTTRFNLTSLLRIMMNEGRLLRWEMVLMMTMSQMFLRSS